MLLSIQSARLGLSKYWLLLSAMNLTGSALFLFSLYKGVIPADVLFSVSLAFAGVGFLLGVYLTYQGTFNSSYALGVFFYWFIVMEILTTGGPVALATKIAGRPDLEWLAFYSFVISMVITLIGGMYNEVKALKLRKADLSDQWKEKLAGHIDYSNQLVRPSLTVDPRSLTGRQAASSSIWIGAAASVNIPLLFEIYGGGRYNAIFFAVPLMMGVFAYLHLTLIGPGLVRLLLLRKLEKSVGYRFINADLEQIQELRRTFFLSRWLMKDYIKPPNAAVATQKSVATSK